VPLKVVVNMVHLRLPTYLVNEECSHISAHKIYLSACGLAGCRPSSSNMLPCGCIISQKEMEYVNNFIDKEGTNNKYLKDEFYYRLGYSINSDTPYVIGISDSRVGSFLYVNSAAVNAGLSSVIDETGLTFRGGFPSKYSIGAKLDMTLTGGVFPHCFGNASARGSGFNTYGSGSAFDESRFGPTSNLKTGFLSSFTHVCDVTSYVVTNLRPSIGQRLECGCKVTSSTLEGMTREKYRRSDMVNKGKKHFRTFRQLLFDSTMRKMDLFLNNNELTGSLMYLGRNLSAKDNLQIEIVAGKVVVLGEASKVPKTTLTRHNLYSVVDGLLDDGIVSQISALRYVQVHSGSHHANRGRGKKS